MGRKKISPDLLKVPVSGYFERRLVEAFGVVLLQEMLTEYGNGLLRPVANRLDGKFNGNGVDVAPVNGANPRRVSDGILELTRVPAAAQAAFFAGSVGPSQGVNKKEKSVVMVTRKPAKRLERTRSKAESAARRAPQKNKRKGKIVNKK